MKELLAYAPWPFITLSFVLSYYSSRIGRQAADTARKGDAAVIAGGFEAGKPLYDQAYELHTKQGRVIKGALTSACIVLAIVTYNTLSKLPA